jgi:WhiB family redox-sensing transcriptional regulator
MELINNDWAKDAMCKGQPQEWWFPKEMNTRESRKLMIQAKTLCNICKVREQCLLSALKNEEVFGIWGGKTPVERGVSRRMRAIAK